MKKAKTIKRAPKPAEVKSAAKVIFVFEARMTRRNGEVLEGWFWCDGPSWQPGEPCTGPFRTEKEAADHADEFGGMVQ